MIIIVYLIRKIQRHTLVKKQTVIVGAGKNGQGHHIDLLNGAQTFIGLTPDPSTRVFIGPSPSLEEAFAAVETSKNDSKFSNVIQNTTAITLTPAELEEGRQYNDIFTLSFY